MSKESDLTVGQIIEKKFLKENNLTQSTLAKAINISRTRMSAIINGKRAITSDTDLRLCRFFGVEDGYFLKLQWERELKKIREKLRSELKRIVPHKQLCKESSLQSFCTSKLKVAIICGGPSLERGISLNSARSVLDHLSREEVEILPIYADVFLNFYVLSKSQLYSNTPSDFDFKLQETGRKLSEEELISKLKEMDMVFPVIHGKYGEDGDLQAFLEKNRIPFIGSDSKSCQKMFDKHNAGSLLKRHGYPTLPVEVLRKNDPQLEKRISAFFLHHELKRVIIKPIAGGSSIGVFSAHSPQEALEKALKLFEGGFGEEALLEPFCHGKEFTVIVLQNNEGEPVALIPTEIEVSYENGGIFDYRRKYLPTANTHWYCPPRFEDKIIEEIRTKAEELFNLFKMRDFARIDGWFLNDGTVLFTDFNPISGMEQNSFIFQQASRIGLTHRDLLWNILINSCRRENITVPVNHASQAAPKERVNVLFGGATAERQVSLMSGTNVWLKLNRSARYHPEPYLLDVKGGVWHLPYSFALNHTVEEIYANCLTSGSFIGKWDLLVEKIKTRLTFVCQDFHVRDHLPRRLTFEEFLEDSKENDAFIFLALHGGEGEDGRIQKRLEQSKLLYNGSDPKTSELCMDKYLTGLAVSKIADPNILTVPKKLIKISNLIKFEVKDYENFFSQLKKELLSETFIIKPQRDGCSAGIVRLFSSEELKKYVDLAFKQVPVIPIGFFKNQNLPVEMPSKYEDDFLLEAFIETDFIRICKNDLIYRPKNGWVELTVGVLEKKDTYHSLSPSITIAEGEVLTVEEKFQGGTGVNITPPAKEIISEENLKLIKGYIEKIARGLEIKNYARLDIFFNVFTQKLYLIEVNTLPGLTPATVLYHQALAETKALYPKDFLEHLIFLKKESFPMS